MSEEARASLFSIAGVGVGVGGVCSVAGVFANNKNIGLIFIAWCVYEGGRESTVILIVPPSKTQVEKENIFLI